MKAVGFEPNTITTYQETLLIPETNTQTTCLTLGVRYAIGKFGVEQNPMKQITYVEDICCAKFYVVYCCVYAARHGLLFTCHPMKF